MTDRPMTVYVATVGLSLFDNILTNSRARIKDAVGKESLTKNIFHKRHEIRGPQVEPADPRAEADLVSELLIKETSDQGEQREELETLVDTIRPDQWPENLSAELASLASDRNNNHRIKTDMENDEMVVLIASDTGPGLRAALFNALVMTEGDVDRVDYLPDSKTPFQVAPGRVAIMRLSGLEAEDNDKFLAAMRELSGFGPHFEELLRHRGSTCRFHLTGGFRVAMPFLLGFAQALRSLYVRVTAHARYEFSNSPRSIELPLSSPPKNLLKGRLSGFDEDGYLAESPPYEKVWEGYAYEYLPELKQWRLTPLGMALRELIPETKQEP